MTGASLPGLSLDQRVPQAFALLLTEANALYIGGNAAVEFIEILQRRVHELRRADHLVLEPFPGDTVFLLSQGDCASVQLLGLPDSLP